MHDESVPLLWGGFELTADIDTIGAGTEGVVCAIGDWFGGYALYRDRRVRALHVRPVGRRAATSVAHALHRPDRVA